MEIKNLNEYKFILSTGCSYGEILKSTFNPFHKISFHSIHDQNIIDLYNQYGKNWLSFDDKIITIDVMLGSQSSDWQSDSIIEATTNLLDLGVRPENIYCLVEWTQWSRYSTTFLHNSNVNLEKIKINENNTDFINLYDNNIKFTDYKEFPFKNLHNKIKVKQSSNYHYIGKINDRFYMTPGHLNRNDFQILGKNYLNFFDDSKKIMEITPSETKLKVYLNNILRTQYFLKSCNVKYDFYFMNCNISNWFKTNELIYQNNEPIYTVENYKIVLNKNRNPLNNPLSDVENILVETGNEISKIDFSKFWMYENSKYRRGGIDEYAIDNFKEVGYITLHQYAEEHLDKFDIIPDFNRHPNFVVYLSLWNEITKNCDFVKVKKDFVDFMLNKFWEDYYYDGFSKNNITMSKKEWEKRFNQ